MSHLLNDAGVSEREAEVLALVGQHLTNAEVAARLFISVRTVESHVSSLLRKLGMDDRRGLAELAESLRPGEATSPAEAEAAEAAEAETEAEKLRPLLPSQLTSFVGRTAERSQLAEALRAHRLVTALGPGGVGKTRLALALAADLSDGYAGGSWYVELVSVTDPTMVGAAVATALGFGEELSRSPAETVIRRLGDVAALVVLDNCEHLLDGVAEFVERLLSACPNVVVLATSRARLLLPFESVFPVPGLSRGTATGDQADQDGDGDGDGGDAVALFLERAAMAGWAPSSDDERRRLVVICSGLDGIALAIELAAARIATLGLGGIEAGLADQLGLLTGGSRIDERHRSVRSALDWSYSLLDTVDQVVLRRTSLFAAPFTAEAAAAVAGHAPLSPVEVAAAIGRLADHSLLVVSAGAGGTRYRMLETIRQYGGEVLTEAGESGDAHARHLEWCLDVAATLRADVGHEAAYDAVVDDLRAALTWAAGQADQRAPAHELALRLAPLAFDRGSPSEAQRRFEQAAQLAADDSEAADALHRAASAATCRLIGNEALDLFRAAAEAARRAGDPRRQAIEITRAAEFIERAPGVLAVLPPPGEVAALVEEAGRLAAGDPEVDAAIATVVAADAEVTMSSEQAERAVTMARAIGDPRLESAALDQLTVTQLAAGHLLDAAASASLRIELLASRPLDIDIAYEYSDALHMAPLTNLGAGDLAAGRRFAQQRLALPFFREEEHLRADWLLVCAALAGDLDDAVGLGVQFRAAWERTGRPPLGGVAVAPAATAMVHGLRGDADARAEWLEILEAMRRVIAHMTGRTTGYGPMFDAMVALHQGDHDQAVATLGDAPETLTHWFTGVWRQWYAAVWAEAGVLAGVADRVDRLARARTITVGNPIAAAMVDRVEAVVSGDPAVLVASARALEEAGCRYQQARSLVFAGGDEAVRGQALLAALGATAIPPLGV